MNIWEKLPKPFFVLAPMDDVTDTVFRQVVSGLAAPDLFFTEFVNVDGLQSAGRENLMPKLRLTDAEKPIIAQIWGKSPENYYKTAKDLFEMGYQGVDINMGCPVKTVVRDGCCVAMMNNRELAVEIIQATKEGAPDLPLSIKTRTGYSAVDLTWHELLLKQKLDALTIHGRTKSQMSKVPADWSVIGQIRELRDRLSPTTKIIGNGDVKTRTEGVELANKYKLDGIMIGRGVFDDPFVFANPAVAGSPWATFTQQKKMDLFSKHISLFTDTWQKNERRLVTLNKFCKIYIQSFDGAKELREKLMSATTAEELLKILA